MIIMKKTIKKCTLKIQIFICGLTKDYPRLAHKGARGACAPNLSKNIRNDVLIELIIVYF